jgi:ATP-dependent Clp protease adapter protein ClpS
MQAIVVTALKEHAEFYSEQLYRQGVRSTIEPDTTTI